MSNIRILIADDHELIRRGLVSALSDRPGLKIHEFDAIREIGL